MSAVKNLITREPVLISGLVDAIIVLAVAFGADLTVEQTGAILAVVSVLTSIVARLFVSPSSSAPVAGDGG